MGTEKLSVESEPEADFSHGRKDGLGGASAKRLSRRSVLAGAVGIAAAASCSDPGGGAAETAPIESAARQRSTRRVVVVGAGAFGGWTALHLLRSGAAVTLIDTWGPGHSRASSGGESRVIRHTYGPTRLYVDWVIRALQLWRENEQRWGRRLYHQTGVLWMVQEQDEYESASLPHLDAAGVEYERLTPETFSSRFPQINPAGIRWAIYEPDAGYLLARRGCEAVLDAFIQEGGEYRQAQASPGPIRGGQLQDVRLSDGNSIGGDRFVFACGSWLGHIFPAEMGPLIQPTRQEVYYFGTPAGVADYEEGSLPVWADSAGRFWYGIPGSERRGFKLADDHHGETVDPTTQDRTLSAEGVKRARSYLEFRFPGMRAAPLVEGRVCQYENSPDGHFIIDRHRRAENLWIVGGGSGHGYKHGPALGEYTARLVLGDGQTEPIFSLARFD